MVKACAVASLIGVLLVTSPAAAQATRRLTSGDLQALKSTSNDPGGDYFTGSREELNRLLDAMAADSSLMSPMALFMAANTAMRIERLTDAAFFLYAAQIRTAFDFERYEISDRANGNNAITYLGFLNQTTGEAVNPAIQREPKLFAAVIARLETWEVVPAANAVYPEFEEATGFKVPREQWAELGRSTREDFLERFGRKQVKLLNDPEYLAAFLAQQKVNPFDPDPKVQAAADANMKRMEDAQARLFPNEQPLSLRAQREAADVPDDVPLRVGDNVPEPKKLRHVEPQFPRGSRGSVILEFTVTRQGKVENVRVLRSDANLSDAAIKAVEQWIYTPVLMDGKPVAVIQNVSLTAK